MTDIIDFKERREQAEQNVRIKKFCQKYGFRQQAFHGKWPDTISVLRAASLGTVEARENLVVEYARMRGLTI